MKTQVLIVGAGPTGLTLAAELTRQGVDFVIVEKNPDRTTLSKALVVHARSLEILDQLGLAEEAIKQGEIANEIRLFVRGKERGGFNLLPMGRGHSDYPFALVLEQKETEKLLANYLEKAEKKILWNHEFIDFKETRKGISAHIKDSKGKVFHLSADYIVGCDGPSSPVRHQLEMPFVGSTFERFFYVADVTMDWTFKNKARLHVFMTGDSFALVLPMKGSKRFRLVGILPEDQKTEEVPFEKVEQKIKRDSKIDFKIKKLHWYSIYRVHRRRAKHFRKGRAFLAGDAAHVHTPAGGQGMNTGIQDAYNLAWKLRMVLNEDASDALLDSYDTERVENAKRLLKSTDFLFSTFVGSGLKARIIRLYLFPIFANIVFKSRWAKQKLFPTLSQIGIKYPKSKLSMSSQINTISAGDRMPFFVNADGSSSHEYIKEPCFHILSFGSAKPIKSKSIKHISALIDTHHFKKIPQKVFGKQQGFYIALRPDNHILYIGEKAQRAIRSIEATFEL